MKRNRLLIKREGRLIKSNTISKTSSRNHPPLVGFCRSLLYYIQWDFWRDFITGLGAEIVLSPPTSQTMLTEGLTIAVDDTCLPVKAFYGHVNWLMDKVDYLLVPRLVSLKKHTFICPKFMGLPDMMRASVTDPPPVIAPKIDANQSAREERRSLVEAAEAMGFSSRDAQNSLRRAGSPHERSCRFLSSKVEDQIASGSGRTSKPKLKLGVLGHPYLLADDTVSANLMGLLLDMGVEPICVDAVEQKILMNYLEDLPKRVFWSEGGRLLAAARYFSRRDDIDGIIQVNAFGCGTDSLLGEEAQRRVDQEGDCPLLSVSLDEHSGKAGLLTRLEAFCDMVERNKRHTGT